jgi:Ca2+-binding RTX toxin-like protein
MWQAGTVFTLSGDNLIYGNAGDDNLISGSGNDTIYSGSGDDVINLRGGSVTLRGLLVEFFGPEIVVEGGGNDTVHLGSGKDTIILGSSGFVSIYGFSRNDLLDVSGLDASFTQVGEDTLISSGDTSLGILKGYTGSVGLV